MPIVTVIVANDLIITVPISVIIVVISSSRSTVLFYTNTRTHLHV